MLEWMDRSFASGPNEPQMLPLPFPIFTVQSCNDYLNGHNSPCI